MYFIKGDIGWNCSPMKTRQAGSSKGKRNCEEGYCTEIRRRMVQILLLVSIKKNFNLMTLAFFPSLRNAHCLRRENHQKQQS
jgi:hypothetical protein